MPMARKLKTENKLTQADREQGATAGHNSEARAATIRDVARRIVQLKGERKAIAEQITEARGEIKGLDIKMADFNVALRLYELEVEDRDAALDGLHESFAALGIGGQLDWVAAIKDVGGTVHVGKADNGAEPLAVKTARVAGREAAKAGKTAAANPHAQGGDLGAEWEGGRVEGMVENAPGGPAAGPRG